MPVADAARSGDRRQTLEALRDALAASIDAADDPRVVAPLAAQLRATLAELADMPVGDRRSILDELTDRRARRRDAAGLPPTSARVDGG